MKDNKILVLTGPSGVGKSTIETYAKENFGFLPTISATTRLPRIGEIQGKDYWFNSHYSFLKKVVCNEFVEYAEFNNEFYGTLRSELEEKLSMGNVICVLEPIGAHRMVELYPNDAIVIVVDASNEILEARMRMRNDDEDSIAKRLAIVEKTREELKDILFVVYNNTSIEETWYKIEDVLRMNNVKL